MNEQPEAADRDDFKWRPIGIALIALVAVAVLAAWSVTYTRPPAPGRNQGPAQAPGKQLPTQRSNPSAEPELVS